jgi:hypothetical protein
MATKAHAPEGWYQDPVHRGQARYWDGAAWLAPAGWYPDPDDPDSTRWWSGTSWEAPRPRVDRMVIQAFASMSMAGVAMVALGYYLLASSLSAPSPTSCPWDGQDGTYDAWVECRRSACHQMDAQVGSSAAAALIPWLMLLALAIVASWLGYFRVRGHSGRVRYALNAALVPAWLAVIALFPGLLALGGVLGDCTT